MVRKKRVSKTKALFLLITYLIIALVGIMITYWAYIDNFISKYKSSIMFYLILAAAIFIFVFVSLFVYINIRNKHRRELYEEILSFLNFKNINSIFSDHDDYITVKSRQTLNNYDDIKYFKDKGDVDIVAKKIKIKSMAKNKLQSFLMQNNFQDKPQYKYVKNTLTDYLRYADGYRLLVVYISSAGNNLGSRVIYLSANRVKEIKEHPEYLMSKGEYNKLLRQQSKDELDAKKREFYDKVNLIIDFANQSKSGLIIKSKETLVDELIQKLFDKTVNSIQKVSKIDSDEWKMLGDFILSIDSQVHSIVENDKRIYEYYMSESFEKIKKTCALLTQSQKEFNEYINEKAQSISKLFGTRIVRNETQRDDVYNYIRTYKKSITPFTAEVSSAVFGSAENNPIAYIVKYFYPNKSLIPEQIERLRILIGELETLKDAKVIIDNYKKDYAQYIQDVPDFVLANDEPGFYSRLGLTIVDESILNVEYKFIYTSDGGMAQRSFTIPMNEDNIAELIHQLEDKLSLETHVKEQRALMTSKLRVRIKERDNYTCRQCGNSIYNEPNLLLEIDHIIPVSRGGLTQEDNLQTLCWKCNRNKGAKIIS